MKNFKNHRTSTIDQQLHMDMLCIPLYTYGIFHCQVRLPKRNNIGSIGQMRSFHSHAEEKQHASETFQNISKPRKIHPTPFQNKTTYPGGYQLKTIQGYDACMMCINVQRCCCRTMPSGKIPDSWIFWANIPDTAGAHQLPPFAETSGGHSTILFSMIWEVIFVGFLDLQSVQNIQIESNMGGGLACFSRV